jgi:hypothetical protein
MQIIKRRQIEVFQRLLTRQALIPMRFWWLTGCSDCLRQRCWPGGFASVEALPSGRVITTTVQHRILGIDISLSEA